MYATSNAARRDASTAEMANSVRTRALRSIPQRMRGWVRPPIVSLLAIGAAACGTEAARSVGPSPLKCELIVLSPQSPVGAQGGLAVLEISTERECGWTVATEASWLSDVRPLSGQGPGRVELHAAPNHGPSRTAAVTIGTEKVSLVQASGCSYAIAPVSQTFTASGGTGSVSITTGPACPWAAVASVGWIAVTGESDVGSGAAGFRVDPNTGPLRSGTMTIADRAFTVIQESGCTYAISPASGIVPLIGGEGSVAVVTAAGCAWNAESLESWILIATGVTGAGPGEVRYLVEPFPGSPSGGRVGTLMVAGHQFRITQHRVAVPR